jgi:hypothetical protein
MNVQRILLGGLVAGIVIVLGEFVLNGLVLAADWEAFRQALALDTEFSTGQLVRGVVITLLYGIVLIWIYAAIRPRFGPGPRTAVLAGLVLWALSYLLFSASLLNGDMMTGRLMLVTSAWGLFEAPLAALAGASVYREA